MAWSRTKVSGVSGTGKIDPDNSSNVIFGIANISIIPISITTANKQTYPGALTFSDFTDMYFHGSGGIGAFNSDTDFSTDNVTTWFRDSGSTTT
jgi:hypothetical protein